MTHDIPGFFSRILAEMDKVVIGYRDVKRLSTAALLSDNHVLLEGLPGTAKSLFVEVFQRAIANSHSVRMQMTADTKPMDLTGVKVYNPVSGTFDIETGPLCGKNFALVDEINRAPGKTLSSLLSAMQERRVYIAGREIVLPDPYFVMATQNPIEQEGVYPLPEASVDRFAMKLIIPYATADDEAQILLTEALDEREPQSVVQSVVDTDAIRAMREQIKRVHVSESAVEYIVKLVRATRPTSEEFGEVAKNAPKVKDKIQTGASVRAQLALRSLSRVLAACSGRLYVLPKDVQEVAIPVLRHRTALTFEAIADGVTSDSLIEKMVELVPFHKDEDKYRQAV